MKQEQIEALKKSIKHWEENLKDPLHAQTGRKHCACCAKWIRKNCKGCPIYQYTGVIYCRDTPYPIVEDMLLTDTGRKCGVNLQKLTAAIQAELDFLKKVLAWVEAKPEDEE